MKTKCAISQALVSAFFLRLFMLSAITLTTFLPSDLPAKSFPEGKDWLPPAPPTIGCNNPIVGKGVVVDQLGGSLVSALASPADWELLTDGDLTNYISFNGLDLVGIGATSLVTLKDVVQTYPAGRRVGFVLEAEGGLLGGDVLSDFEIRTYLNNQLQETAPVGDVGSPIEVAINAGAGSRRRVSFVTTQAFDEVELYLRGVANISLVSAVRIYYAYEEVGGCDYNCITALTSTNYPAITASTDCETFLGPVCIEDGFENFDNTINADTTDRASDLFVFAESHYLDLDIGEDIPAGYEVGFAVEQVGLLNLLTLNVLSGIEITTYDDDIEVESIFLNDPLANVGVLNGGINLLSFVSSQAFDQVRITISSVLGLGTTYRIYYGFVRPDSDIDGFPDCVDTCVGDNNFDEDGDGTPDDCDMDCVVDAGPDFNVCSDADTFTIFAAGAGETWSVVAGNPGSATITPAGVVTGLTVQGAYQFELSNGACFDIVTVTYVAAQGDLDCNVPIAGAGTLINDNGSCQMCGSADANNLTDGDLGNYAEDNNLLSLSITIPGTVTPLISVRDTLRQYPAGARAGFALSFPAGLLSTGLLTAFELRTYNDGVLVETAGSGAMSLVSVDALATDGLQRVSFLTTQAFDEVEIAVQGGLVSLDLLTTVRVFYAFTADPSCASASDSADITEFCGIPLTAVSDYCARIVYERSSFSGIGCVGCTIDSIGYVIAGDLTQSATIDLVLAALGDVSLSVGVDQDIPAGTRTGFAVEFDNNFLDLDVLQDLEINTYNDGVLQESFSTNSPLVSLNLFGNGSNTAYFSVVTGVPFDEVQVTVDASVAGATIDGGVIRIYYAYIQSDIDGDGTPDCLDKCCSGDDNDDGDGDGQPQPCDILIAADDDSEQTPMDTPVDVEILSNDDFGSNGPANVSVRILQNPENGAATINDNGTPANFTDDFVVYTPDNGFTGMDSLTYIIQDLNFSTDTAMADIEVLDVVGLNLKVFLLGALWPDVSGTALMRDDLRTDDYIPLMQPYTSALNPRFAQIGGGAEVTTAGVLDANAGTGDAIVDWIFIELRDPTDNEQVLLTFSALLQRDGDVVAIDGGPVNLSVPLPPSFFVAIKHRNHLGVMTLNPVSVIAGIATVDFTTLSTADLWNEPGFEGLEVYTLANGNNALWAGNANADGKLKYQGASTDPATVLIDAITHPDNDSSPPIFNFNDGLGYYQGDLNLDGKVKYQGAGNDLTVLFINLISYPLNTGTLYNYDLFLEQIPTAP